MTQSNDTVYSQPVVEFVAVANEFCQLIESVQEHPTHKLIDVGRKLLSLLYFKASLLPELEPILDDALEKYVNELDYNLLMQKWLNKLGEHDHFYEIFDPEIQFGTETVTASISENLLDIYQDTKDFISAYNFGNEEVMNDAIAECSSQFRNVWGQRLVNVLRALHQLYFSDTDWSEKPIHLKTPDDDDLPKGKWVDRFFNHASE